MRSRNSSTRGILDKGHSGHRKPTRCKPISLVTNIIKPVSWEALGGCVGQMDRTVSKSNHAALCNNAEGKSIRTYA